MTGFGGQAVLIISGILAARILGVEGRGYLGLLIIFPIVLCQLGGLGLPQAVILRSAIYWPCRIYGSWSIYLCHNDYPV